MKRIINLFNSKVEAIYLLDDVKFYSIYVMNVFSWTVGNYEV